MTPSSSTARPAGRTTPTTTESLARRATAPRNLGERKRDPRDFLYAPLAEGSELQAGDRFVAVLVIGQGAAARV